MVESLFYTFIEAAALHGVPKTTFKKWINEGVINPPVVRRFTGSHIRLFFPKKEYINWLNSEPERQEREFRETMNGVRKMRVVAK